MKIFSNIVFPAAVIAMTAAFASTPSRETPTREYYAVQVGDTIIYPNDGYKLRRGNRTMPDEKLPDSVLLKAGITVNIPDSLEVEDTTATQDSLTEEQKQKLIQDSIAKAMKAWRDSVDDAKEAEKARRDSIRENTPRILETFAIPDSMQYKRIIQWSVNQDFHDMKVELPDTGYNYHFNDYPFLREDVNATWLGVAGSSLQTYNYFKRDTKNEGVEYYRTLESWAYTPESYKQYNTKTAYTELAYYGTLLAGSQKESDNLHILTTQNILPELNFVISYDRYAGEGILQQEQTKNRNFGVGVNYLGKKYLMNFGYLRNTVLREENGGVANVADIRDTTLDAREVAIRLSSANSVVKKNTVYLDQQFRIPFNFILNARKKKDSTYVVPEFERDITTAFVGHSSELSVYTRKYTDAISSSDVTGQSVYLNQDGQYLTNYNATATSDSIRTLKLDNKVFIRLQPFKSDGIVSKLDVGIGDRYMNYGYGSYEANLTDSVRRASENSVYAYAGVKGQYDKYLTWGAKAHYTFAGARAGDFDVNANADFNLYPFRKAKYSPLTITAAFTQTLQQPTYFQEHMWSNHYKWENDFDRISQTKIEGTINIPYWKMDAQVGYALNGNLLYYDNWGIIRQSSEAVSVITAGLRKEFVFWNFLHLDNRLLYQFSSNKDILPLPDFAVNLKYFIQFVVKKDALKNPIMTMQIGVNGKWNTAWYAPAYNPATNVFQTQSTYKYYNGPILDAFINMQWKRATIFIKYEDFGQGWPKKKDKDYFAADRYIVTQRTFKIGIYWPFYLQPNQNKAVSFSETAKKTDLNKDSGK